MKDTNTSSVEKNLDNIKYLDQMIYKIDQIHALIYSIEPLAFYNTEADEQLKHTKELYYLLLEQMEQFNTDFNDIYNVLLKQVRKGTDMQKIREYIIKTVENH